MPVLTLNQQISEVDSNLEKTSVWLISPSRSSPCVTLECWQCSVYLNHSLDGWWMTTFTWRFAMDFMKIRSLRSCSGLSLIKRAGSLSTTQRPKSFFPVEECPRTKSVSWIRRCCRAENMSQHPRAKPAVPLVTTYPDSKSKSIPTDSHVKMLF